MTTVAMQDDKTNCYRAAAIKAGEWFLKTQQTRYDDANRGRYYYAVNLKDDYQELSTGWQTGFAVIAMLSLHKTTEEKKYLESAELAIEYIKTLQILDKRRMNVYGAIREESPQTNWLHPRDALSAAWALLIYGQYRQDNDCLERAVMFADWMINYGFSGDWPLFTVNLGPGGLDSRDLQGSFQSGGILFFIDMYKMTQDMRYYNIALRMSDYYVENFIDPNGLITVLIDKLGIQDLSIWQEDWKLMHRVNDDFGGIALAASYSLFQKDVYRQRMSAYFDWSRTADNGDGSYLKPVMEVGSATMPIFFNSYKKFASEAEQVALKQAHAKALDFLVSLQQHSTNDAVDGALLGMDNKCRNGVGEWVNIRCTAYAIIALLQYSGDSLFPYSSVETDMGK